MATMGLELHLQSLKTLEETIVKLMKTESESVLEKIKHFSVKSSTELSDIANACQLASSTLNDMLTFEKIETGMLAFHRSVLPVIEFVTSEFRAFFIQVSYCVTSLLDIGLVQSNEYCITVLL